MHIVKFVIPKNEDTNDSELQSKRTTKIDHIDFGVTCVILPSSG